MGVVVVTRKGASLGTHEVGASPLTVGTDEACSIHLSGPGVDPQHLLLVEKRGLTALKNTGSPGVAFLNGTAVADVVQVQNGDTIRIGEYQLQYLAQRPQKGTGGPDEACSASAPPTEGETAEESAETSAEENGSTAAPSEVGGESEGSALIGEFVAADADDEESLETSGSIECEPVEISPTLRELVQGRLEIFNTLDAMDEERRALLDHEGIPEQAEHELRRQLREAQSLPSAEAAQAHIDKLEKKLEALKERMERGEAEPHPPMVEGAIQMAVRQWRLCIERENLLPDILRECRALATEEPLHAVLKASGVEVEPLFGWAIYGLALMTLRDEWNAESKQLRRQLEAMEGKQQGLLSRLRGQSEDEKTRTADLAGRHRRAAKLVQQIHRELASIEKQMVEEFWRVYAEAAGVLVKGRLAGNEELLLRAFLRYGLVGVKPWFLPAETARHLLDACRDVRKEWDYAMGATHVLYADEYIAFVAHGRITPSIDENLELNLRNSPEWKADKAWRRMVHTHVAEAALRETAAHLAARIEEIQSRREELEVSRDKLIRSAPDYTQRHREISQQVQRCRVEAGRFQRAVDRIREQQLPHLEDVRTEAEKRFEEAGFRPTREYLIRREAAGIHRVSRLCANLKERFPPFTLRERLRVGGETVNDRACMLEAIEDLERRDPTIFKEPLIPVKKKAHRIYLRYSPTLLLTPSCGFISYSWNPRYGPETGRLAVPGYTPRAGIRERMLHNAFADFRWDTSKASAGVDLLTSETLVAEYSRVRWEYRKRGKETREKAAIYNEDNDRRNWRRHYTLYLSSALDGGKLLFFKCNEVYEQVVLKYLDLPEGVERLRR